MKLEVHWGGHAQGYEGPLMKNRTVKVFEAKCTLCSIPTHIHTLLPLYTSIIHNFLIKYLSNTYRVARRYLPLSSFYRKPRPRDIKWLTLVLPAQDGQREAPPRQSDSTGVLKPHATLLLVKEDDKSNQLLEQPSDIYSVLTLCQALPIYHSS